MARSLFRAEKVVYQNLKERLEARPWRMPDKELSVQTVSGRMAGPSEPDLMAGVIPCGMPKPPKPDSTRLMTRNQRKLL